MSSVWYFPSWLHGILTAMIMCPVHPKTSLAKEQYSGLHIPTGQVTFVILSFNDKLLNRNTWNYIGYTFIMLFILILYVLKIHCSCKYTAKGKKVQWCCTLWGRSRWQQSGVKAMLSPEVQMKGEADKLSTICRAKGWWRMKNLVACLHVCWSIFSRYMAMTGKYMKGGSRGRHPRRSMESDIYTLTWSWVW